MAKILVVEDDRTLSEALSYNFRQEGYTPLVAADAVTARRMLRAERFDLVLLDLMLPGGSGFDICRELRTFSTVPIVILTARDEDVDRVLGLEIGADDYITKPFALRELLARVKANLRRVEMDRQGLGDEPLHWGDLEVDTQQRQVAGAGAHIALQPKEFDLLVYLMRHPGVVLTRDRLLHAVWGHEFVGERTVDVHVRRVRAKLEQVGVLHAIRTVHGVGYAFASGQPEAGR
ncbi:MAG: response regulator transcription factor [Chloroflexota bacterium]